MSKIPPVRHYQDAGVDIEKGNRLIDRIKPFAKRTLRPEVLAGVGGFSALFELPAGYSQPVLVSSTDGVGTKLKLAIDHHRHETIGFDLLAMCVNDVICCGADPLFFLDYYATSHLNVDVATAVIASIAKACESINVALIGGETAEMPGMYTGDDYDLAGFCVGIVEKDNIIDGSKTEAGDKIIGLAASGIHSNGYSLVRAILNDCKTPWDTPCGDTTLLDALLMPTRIYHDAVLAVRNTVAVHAIAHITGGGLLENLPRVTPSHLCIKLNRDAWPTLPVFDWLTNQATLTDHEFYRTFNAGIGMAITVPASMVDLAMTCLQRIGEKAYVCGDIRVREPNDPLVEIR